MKRIVGSSVCPTNICRIGETPIPRLGDGRQPNIVFCGKGCAFDNTEEAAIFLGRESDAVQRIDDEVAIALWQRRHAALHL